jgi:hypothetical protein
MVWVIAMGFSVFGGIARCDLRRCTAALTLLLVLFSDSASPKMGT